MRSVLGTLSFIAVISVAGVVSQCDMLNLDVRRHYHANEKLAWERSLNARGRPDGLARWWYETGVLEQEAMYINGEIIWKKCYASDGRLEEELREGSDYLLVPVQIRDQ